MKNFLLSLLILIISFSVFTFSARFFDTTDSMPNNFTALNLIFNRRLDLTNLKEDIANRGIINITIQDSTGKLFSKTPPLLGVISVPGFLFINTLFGVNHLTNAQIVFSPYSQYVGKLIASFFTSLSAAILFWLLIKVCAKTSSALLMVAVYCFATNIFNTVSQNNWQHSYSLLFIVSFLWLVVAFPKKAMTLAIAGAFLGLASQVRISNIFYLLFPIFFLRSRKSLAILAGFALVYVAISASYFLGHIPSGYQSEITNSLRQVSPVSAVINGASLLLSFNYGFFVFSPIFLLVFLLVFRRKLSPVPRSLLPTLVIFIIFASIWKYWTGGVSLNARLLSETLPIWVLLLYEVRETYGHSRMFRLAFATLFAVSVLINILTTFAMDWAWFPVYLREGAANQVSNAWRFRPTLLEYLVRNRVFHYERLVKENDRLLVKSFTFRPSLGANSLNFFEKKQIPILVTREDLRPHYTLIINQIRGPECCDTGNFDFLKGQLQTLEQNHLSATFAVRFDALNDIDYIETLRQANKKGFEIGALLEVTPALASQSAVDYHQDLKWYQPGNLYLIGYTQEQRKRLIDTYMARYTSVFGQPPKTTVAWIIDAYSLQYLSEKYHIAAHEITREQWHTDVITLDGGPAHYPYIPSPNWPLLPSGSRKEKLPVIIRQTITDPVENYGDSTSSHTSQPNDFMSRTSDFNYFENLFNQAHNQELGDYTFAVIGLENSMAEPYQKMFARQIEFIGDWQKENKNNLAVSAESFVLDANRFLLPDSFNVYEGSVQNDPRSRAWWIGTAGYRVRLRLDKNSLYISDIRTYNPGFTDPYWEKTASSSAFWVVPFLVDGSRFRQNDPLFASILDAQPDSQKSTRIVLKNRVNHPEKYVLQRENDKLVLYDEAKHPVVSFTKDWFFPVNPVKDLTDNPYSLKISQNLSGQELETLRQKYPAVFLPQLSNQPVDQDQSFLYVNNRYAIFGRNPVRFVFYPRDKSGYPARVSSLSTSGSESTMNFGEQDELGGGIMVDINSDRPQQIGAEITADGQTFRQTVYFAPNCQKNPFLCLKNPRYLLWYLNTIKP